MSIFCDKSAFEEVYKVVVSDAYPVSSLDFCFHPLANPGVLCGEEDYERAAYIMNNIARTKPDLTQKWTERQKRDGDFVRFMREYHAILQRGENVDAVLLNAMSAIALADAFRGFHDEIGETHPMLLPAFINSWNCKKKADMDQETARLTPFLAGKNSVVVDEYFHDGNTTAAAIDVATAAGSKVLTFSVFELYEESSKDDIDLDGMTTKHAPFMHEMGRIAAKIVRAANPTTLDLNAWYLQN
ncbi:hypothetical protein FWF74_03605 [Candidatus Saccharibacteria bacterium]|nr:hypothetical protein [Candidatus Saccharibacteria bacterium]MCL1962859.1 hypothetical protein [Candidatus Saccharibacteria bacterium]